MKRPKNVSGLPKPDYQGMSKKEFLELWFDTCKTIGFTRKEAIFYLHHQGIYVTK